MKNNILVSILCSISFVCAADRDYSDDEKPMTFPGTPPATPIIPPMTLRIRSGSNGELSPLTARLPQLKTPRDAEWMTCLKLLRERNVFLFPDDVIVCIAEQIIGCRPHFPGCKPTVHSLIRDGNDIRSMALTCKDWFEAINNKTCALVVAQNAFTRSGISPYVVIGLLNFYPKRGYNYLYEEKKTVFDIAQGKNYKQWKMAQFIDAWKSVERLMLLYSEEDIDKRFVCWLDNTVSQIGGLHEFKDTCTTNMVRFSKDIFLYATEQQKELKVWSLVKDKKPICAVEDLVLSSADASFETGLQPECKKIISSRLTENNNTKQMLLAFIQKSQNDKTALCVYEKISESDKQVPAAGRGASAPTSVPEAYQQRSIVDFDTLQNPTLLNALWYNDTLIAQGVDNQRMFIIKFLRNDDGSLRSDQFLANKPVKTGFQEVRSMAIDCDGNIYAGNCESGGYVAHVDGLWGEYKSWLKKIFLINYFRKKLGF